jgi:tRNA(Ile)-lysidine synthase
VTKRVLNPEWIARLSEFTQLIVGFSGGLDSTVLVHVLASYPSLRNKLTAVHINHGISSNSLSWQNYCEQFCLKAGINFVSQPIHFDRSANIEDGARIARYKVFSSLLTEQDCLILGHHRDDQAETVLLQLFRGAGIDGLAAMMEVGTLGKGTIARPLLSYSRQQLELYAASHELQWIEDESNQDSKYSRNYVRHEIMPLLAAKWPGVVANIARTATHCQQAKVNLEELAVQDSPALLAPDTRLFIEPLKALSFERITNVLRSWLKKNQIQLPSTLTFQRLIHEGILASQDAVPMVAWGDIQVRRYQGYLYLDRKDVIKWPSSLEWANFPCPLVLNEYNLHLFAKKANQGLMIPQHAKILIKFRQGGEQFYWHGQNKELKKLFQEWGIPPWQRKKIPLIYLNDQLAAVVGYAVSDLFFSADSSQSMVQIVKNI